MAHPVARKTAVAAYAPPLLALCGVVGTDDGGFVGHLQTVGHMARKRHIEHQGALAAALHDVLHRGYECACAPSEGTAGLEDYPQIGVTLTEATQSVNQQVYIVTFAGHKMTAAHIEPLNFIQQVTELPLHNLQRGNQVLGLRLTQRVEVEALNALGKFLQQLGTDAKTACGRCGVVEVRFDGRVFVVDAQTARDTIQQGPLAVALPLPERVEGYVVAVAHELLPLTLRVDGCVGVCPLAILLVDQAGLGQRACRSAVGVLAEDGKDTPHCARFEGHDNLHARLTTHTVDDGHIFK